MHFPIRLLVIFFLPLLFAACSTDPCAEITCLNDGRCVAGECQCADNFEGTDCGTLERTKFLGIYPGGEGYCSFSQFTLGAHEIVASPIHQDEIYIDDGVLDQSIRAVVDGWTFTIPEQEVTYTDSLTQFEVEIDIVGQGWLDLDAGMLVYQFDNNGCRYELVLP